MAIVPMLTLINTIFAYIVIIIAGLSQLTLFKYSAELNAFLPYEYSLLYMAAFVLAISFGHNYAFIASVLYLVSGLLGLPVFAFGGGFGYIFEPSFGFILGLFPLSIVAFYNKFYAADSGLKSFCGLNLSPLLGLLYAHLVGLLYMLVTGRFNFTSFLGLHLLQLLYDLVFALGILAIINLYAKNNGKVTSEQDLIADL